MARSPADGEGSKETTLIFPKKSAWDELVEAKTSARKKNTSANGVFSKALARLVEEEHMDRRAAGLVLKLHFIEDDEDLHVAVFHLIDGLKKLGILKRAMATEDMFDDRKIDTEALDEAETKRGAKGRGGGRGAGTKKAAGVHGDELPEGVASFSEARDAREQAGGAA